MANHTSTNHTAAAAPVARIFSCVWTHGPGGQPIPVFSRRKQYRAVVVLRGDSVPAGPWVDSEREAASDACRFCAARGFPWPRFALPDATFRTAASYGVS